jgi:Protein of unknown function (DUF1697)
VRAELPGRPVRATLQRASDCDGFHDAQGGSTHGLSKGTKVTAYVALLRAVNVGGTGKPARSDLEVWCVKAGFSGANRFARYRQDCQPSPTFGSLTKDLT